MKKKLVLGVLLLALVFSLGAVACGGSEVVNTVTPTPGPTMGGNEPPITSTWLSPAKVIVGNFYPGARAEWPITIHNGNNYEAQFEISYRVPDNVQEGYARPTVEVADWVIIVDTTPVLAAYQTKEIAVVLDMPGNAKSPGDDWEFWVSVKDKSQGGFVQTEICSRWLVNMQ